MLVDVGSVHRCSDRSFRSSQTPIIPSVIVVVGEHCFASALFCFCIVLLLHCFASKFSTKPTAIACNRSDSRMHHQVRGFGQVFEPAALFCSVSIQSVFCASRKSTVNSISTTMRNPLPARLGDCSGLKPQRAEVRLPDKPRQ